TGSRGLGDVYKRQKQDMANVTSNLRFYLVFTLNQLIVFLTEREDSTRELDISHFLGKFNILT
ncbi:hypothetical protein KZY59_12100, partial [Prevotella buccae]|uniref:hypothetical protein n=1 Tax=Segatella buccae TaxID=28126 RepID=UPI001C606EF0